MLDSSASQGCSAPKPTNSIQLKPTVAFCLVPVLWLREVCPFEGFPSAKIRNRFVWALGSGQQFG